MSNAQELIENQQNRRSYIEEIFEITGLKYNREEYWLRQSTDSALLDAERLLPGDGVRVGLNTGAGGRWPTRLWPAASWRELIRLLLQAGVQPVILGGPEEESLNSNLARATGARRPGAQPMDVFYALVQRCSCLVTSVTQAMHLAIGARAPLVLFNNIFNRHEFELYDRGVVIEPPVPCDCFYSPVCRTGRDCINEISPSNRYSKLLCGF